MPNSTNISWTDTTWNPITGCSKISRGCANCFAAALAPRLAKMGAKGYTELPWTAANAGTNVHVHAERLEQPLRWRKPRRAFVASMADLFHEQIPDDVLDKVFAVMALARRHAFQVLTKRPERMAAYLTAVETEERLDSLVGSMARSAPPATRDHIKGREAAWLPLIPSWPLPNVWLGVSVEDQRAADQRVPYLLDTPAAIRFLSCEPLLEGVDLRAVRRVP